MLAEKLKGSEEAGIYLRPKQVFFFFFFTPVANAIIDFPQILDFAAS